MDANLWGGEDQWTINNTIWATNVTTNNNNWILPAMSGTFGPAAGSRGEFVNHETTPNDVVFCTHIRLTQLLNTPGAGLLRSEVRVFWPKGGASWNDGANYCRNNAGVITQVGANTTNFHFVYKTTAIRETPK